MVRLHGAVIWLNPSSSVRFLISLLPYLFVLGLNTSILPIKHLRQLLVHVLLDEDDEIFPSDSQDAQRLGQHHDKREHVREVEVGHPGAMEQEGVGDLQELIVHHNDEIRLYSIRTGNIRD